MSRPLRLEIPGGFFHVTSRGDRRGPIYLKDCDRTIWLSIFEEVCRKYNWVCHSYCLMVNHYHIVVETPEANLSRGMRQLNGVYAQSFNHRHELVGHVFQGRFKSILVDKDSYLLELSRYVPLNPVRVGITKDASDWPWSSYRSFIGKSPVPAWLNTDWILGQFHSNRLSARRYFIDFVRAGIELPSIWDELKHGFILGTDQYIEKISSEFNHFIHIREVSRVQRRALAKPLEEYKKQFGDKHIAISEAYRSGGYTMKEIADFFKVHYSTVSRAVKNGDKHQ